MLMTNDDDRATGVICSNDLMAIGALQEAATLGLRVPDDLSIVGFDGIDATTWTQPPLTTVEQPIYEIARTTVTALTEHVPASRAAPAELRLQAAAACGRDNGTARIRREAPCRAHECGPRPAE